MTISPNRRRIDIIADPEFIDALTEIPMKDLRERRALCDGLDTELSFYRRMLHGRMDLLNFELRRRSGAETRSLLEALPEILAGAEAGAPLVTTGRAVPVVMPDIPDEGRRTIDHVLRDDFLAHLPSTETAELESILANIADVEQGISGQRRLVYDVYEKLQAELTRRYREGIADVGELLSGS